MSNHKDLIRQGIDSIIKGDKDAGAAFFSQVLPIKSRAILNGEDEDAEDVEDNVEDENDESLEDLDDTVEGDDDEEAK